MQTTFSKQKITNGTPPLYKKRGEVLLIIFFSILAYGLLIPWLSRYMDDWEHTFSFQNYGPNGLIYYFKQSRPLLGLLFRLNISLLQNNTLLFQLFGLFWRITGSLAFFGLVSLLWPDKRNLTFFAGLLFAVYPGYLLQPISFSMGHSWIVYTLFLISNCLTVLAVRKQGKKYLFSILAVFSSLLNILMMEYFLPLEIVRLFIIFFLIARTEKIFTRLIKAFYIWLPYLFCLVGVTVFRVLFYADQTYIYPMGLFETFRQSFSAGITLLVGHFFIALYQSIIQAWIQPFQILFQFIGNSRTFLGIAAVVFFSAMILLFFFLTRRISTDARMDWSPLVISVVSLLLAGIPFYITLLPVKAVGLNSRFTLPFIFGVSLLFAFLLDLIPSHIIKAIFVSLLISFAVGFQLFNENSFRLMAEKYKNFIYQISWRAPDLKPGSLIISNELEDSNYYNFSNLRNMLNLAYPHDLAAPYDWAFSRDLASRIGISDKTPSAEDVYNLISQSNDLSIVVFQLEDEGCIRFIESGSEFINSEILKYGFQKLSNPDSLMVDPVAQIQLDPTFIGKEPSHGWCYYYEKADLAIQQKDYEAVEMYYQKVLEEKLWTRQSLEWFPFIEGLAGSGDWMTALSISRKIINKHSNDSSYRAFICQRLKRVLPSDPFLYDQAITTVKALGCQ